MTSSIRFINADHTLALLSFDGQEWTSALPPTDNYLRAVYDAWIVAGNTPEPYVPPPAPPARIEWGALIRALAAEEAEQFDAAVQAAPARFRWLVQKTAYISTDDPDYPTLKAAFDSAYGKARSDELLPQV